MGASAWNQLSRHGRNAKGASIFFLCDYNLRFPERAQSLNAAIHGATNDWKVKVLKI